MALEDAARELGYERARLDTGPDQHGARRMYLSAGYEPIENFNGNPIATFFGEKTTVSAMTESGGNRDSRLLVGAVGLSAGGDFLALIPLAALVSEISGSGWAVSGLFVALWGPMVLFSSPAGKLIDRVETRGLLISTSLVQAVIAAALILATDSVGTRSSRSSPC